MIRKLLLILYGSFAVAQHAPVGEPSGNPFSRPLNEIVTACTPFTITWQPTTSNTISLVLLRGPAENIRPVSTIITGIANSGSYAWTPSGALEADATHYGLQLIDDVTGQFQYSVQFGITKGSNCDNAASLSPSSANTLPSSSRSAVAGASSSAVPPASVSPSVASSSVSAKVSTSPLPAASDRSQDTSSRGRSALKPGIAAAIGVSATAGVALFATAVFMAYRLGRRRDTAQQGEAEVLDADTKVDYLKPELHAQSVGELHGHHVVHELHGGSAVINEMASPVAELHDEAVRKELDGGATRKKED